MPRRQKRFVCFYCSCRSASSLPADTRRWECKSCNAVNHLDENGEITDPPTTESQPETRFAKPRPRSESPPGLGIKKEPESPFCQRCLQNQLIIKDILSDFTPSDDDDWEQKYKVYVQELEKNYPPICDMCEAQARTRMQKSDYYVSADNLGRSLKRSHSNESWLFRRGWEYNSLSLILTLGKIMWWTSWIGQFLWHALNLLKTKQILECPWKATRPQSNLDCIPQLFSLDPLHRSCLNTLTSLAGWAVVLGMVSIWWNPMLERKLKLIYGRSTGKTEYYTLQVIFIFVRSVVWVLLEKPRLLESEFRVWQAMHAFMLPVTLLSAVIPYRAVKWDSTPRVARTYSPGSLLAQEPRTPRTLTRPDQPDFTAQMHQNFGGSRSNKMNQRFPIDRLAQAPPQQFQPRFNPPTPPPDEDDADMMDWQPSQQQYDLRAATSYRDTQQRSKPALAQPSPFYGHLPPNPVSPAHALRNPPYQPPPMERASAQQHNFFNRNGQRPINGFASISNQNEGGGCASPVSNRMMDSFSPNKFAGPKFFPKNIVQDTGLEDLFTKATTLRARPPHLPSSTAATLADDENLDMPTGSSTYSYGTEISEARRKAEAPRSRPSSSFRYMLVLTAVAVVVLGFVAQKVYFEDRALETLVDRLGDVRCKLGGSCSYDDL